jgi:hypothetical protein
MGVVSNDQKPAGETFSMSRRELLVTGLWLGISGAVAGYAVLRQGKKEPPALPVGFAYVCFQDAFLTVDGAYLIAETARW